MKPLLWILAFTLTFQVLAQKQGVKGMVFWVDGNQMPAPGKNVSPQLGTQREIFVYETTRLQDVKHDSGFFSEVPTKLITQSFSKPDGSFTIKLEPGTYSVFVKEDKGLYANLFGQEGLINPVIVKPKNFTWLIITIDYQAAY